MLVSRKEAGLSQELADGASARGGEAMRLTWRAAVCRPSRALPVHARESPRKDLLSGLLLTETEKCA